jgi:hypothetical protein
MKMGKFGQFFTGVTKNLTITVLGGCTMLAIPQPSHANAPDFYCGSTTYQGQPVPATWARKRNGDKVLVIRWFRSVGKLTAWQRCQLVSRRFQTYYDRGQLQYIKGEFENKEPVLCTVASPWEPCNKSNILFTLDPQWRNNPQAAAEKLFNRNGFAGGRVLNENNAQSFYIDFQAYLEAAKEEKE